MLYITVEDCMTDVIGLMLQAAFSLGHNEGLLQNVAFQYALCFVWWKHMRRYMIKGR